MLNVNVGEEESRGKGERAELGRKMVTTTWVPAVS